MGVVRKFILALCVFPALVAQTAPAQEAVMEEIVVETPFDVRLELPRESAVQIMIERLKLRDEARHALELKIANRTPLSTLLDLTKYSPIPLGGSDNRIDTFFLQNYMRADLKARDEDLLNLRR